MIKTYNNYIIVIKYTILNSILPEIFTLIY